MADVPRQPHYALATNRTSIRRSPRSWIQRTCSAARGPLRRAILIRQCRFLDFRVGLLVPFDGSRYRRERSLCYGRPHPDRKAL